MVLRPGAAHAAPGLPRVHVFGRVAGARRLAQLAGVRRAAHVAAGPEHMEVGGVVLPHRAREDGGSGPGEELRLRLPPPRTHRRRCLRHLRLQRRRLRHAVPRRGRDAHDAEHDILGTVLPRLDPSARHRQLQPRHLPRPAARRAIHRARHRRRQGGAGRAPRRAALLHPAAPGLRARGRRDRRRARAGPRHRRERPLPSAAEPARLHCAAPAGHAPGLHEVLDARVLRPHAPPLPAPDRAAAPQDHRRGGRAHLPAGAGGPRGPLRRRGRGEAAHGVHGGHGAPLQEARAGGGPAAGAGVERQG
mmetsp:Transcript_25549/g.79971  ORF Transcript_25549/g.79971 Transcript_25549/m.79971 type:complete len:305 (+) Transcript_25549:332-1246(+)